MAKNLLDQLPEIREMEVLQRFLEDGRAQGIVEGRAEEARAVLLRQGQKKFGPVSPEQFATITAMTDLARLDALIDRVLDARTWDELLKPT